MVSRREFLKISAAMGGGALISSKFRFLQRAFAQIPGGTLSPSDVDKFVLPLVKPPAMPGKFNKNKDKYKIVPIIRVDFTIVGKFQILDAFSFKV